LRDQLQACLARPMICICNGFQIALRAGCFGTNLALATNAGGAFQDCPEQPHQVVQGNPSRWLKGMEGETLVFPCAHAEGRFVYRQTGSWRAALRYPGQKNPDGSSDGIAGITTPDGLVLGLMNHPERAINREANLTIFENGVRAAAG
jgi:phosphoribosylformylglycinamidine (FGAM) synthase-like amidotransferase family enzyme